MASLRFRLFGFPVEIQPGFWLLAFIIGFSGDRSAAELAAWVGIVFVSVLVHELGHAFAARAYGERPVIALHMMGGLTSWTPTRELSRRARILVTLAGPGAGFALGALAFVALLALSGQRTDSGQSGLLFGTLRLLLVANVFWSVINLMPVLPFDGGQILATALGAERRKLAATISLVFGLITAAVLLRMGSLLGALVFGLGGVSSFLAALRAAPARLPPHARRELLDRARAQLAAGELEQAAGYARVLAQTADDVDGRREALQLLGWIALESKQIADARALARDLEALGGADPYLLAAVALADEDRARARKLLLAARERGDARPELLSLLVRVELESDEPGAAALLALELVDAADADELRAVAAAAFDGDAPLAGARLLAALFQRDGEANDAFAAARAFARGGERDDAVRLLADAVRAGHDVSHARQDADLGTLAEHPDFPSALAGQRTAT